MRQQIKVSILKDFSDNKFLELAAVSNAEFLVTGNSSDFNIEEFESTKIVSAREYFQGYSFE